MRIIGLRSDGWDDTGLTGALAAYDHPADLLAHYAVLPLGWGAGEGTV